MSVQEAIRPYLRQAEEEFDHVARIRDEVHVLLVETAAKVGADDGAQQGLIEALDALSTAHRSMSDANAALVRARAWTLCYGSPEAGVVGGAVASAEAKRAAEPRGGDLAARVAELEAENERLRDWVIALQSRIDAARTLLTTHRP